MCSLLLVLLLATFSSVVALTDVDQKCIADNSELLSNDNLLGKWYWIWKFTGVGAMVPSFSCFERNFTRPTAEVIQKYKKEFNNLNLPYNIDDNPVLVTKGFNLIGMVVGHNVAKFYIPKPNPACRARYTEWFVVEAYRPLSPKYIMYTQCELRGFTRWLLTTDRYAPVAEIEELIKNTPELNEMDGQRHCATY